jgi:hypothetical protein
VKSAKDLVRLFEEKGFTLARDKNHRVWRCPCGHATVTVAKSSGGGRGEINAQLQLKRTLRVCLTKKDATP